MLTKTLAAAVSSVALLTCAASAATLDFGTAAAVTTDAATGARTYDLGGGLTVTITSGTINDTGGAVTTVDNSLVDFDDGTFQGLGSNALPGGDNTIDSNDDVDDENEFVQLVFNQLVDFNSFTVGKADRLDDVTVLDDGSFLFRVGTKQDPDNTGTAEFEFEIPVGVVGQSFIIAAGQLGSNNTSVEGTRNDDFILTALDAAEVPLPGAALLFGSALVGAAARRRRS